LDQVETEGRVAKGRAMQLSQALEKAKAAHTKAVKVKEKKQPKVQVEEGEVEEAATLSDQTMYRRATVLTGVILDLAKESGPGFGRLWAMVMRNKKVKDAFCNAGLRPYHNEADKRETEMVDRLRDVVQWAKANHRETHPRQVYEALITAVADSRPAKDGGTTCWAMKRLGIGVTAMQSGVRRRKVLDESSFQEGVVFNDDRCDSKTKNDKFPAGEGGGGGYDAKAVCVE